jgi:hypothetical protein
MGLLEPLSRDAAKARAVAIMARGRVAFVRHARERLAERGMTALDCSNVIRGGFVAETRFENGSWRYRFQTRTMAVVIAFRSQDEFVVVSLWRLQE